MVKLLGVTWINDYEKGCRLIFYTWTYWMHWYFNALLFAKVKNLLQWVMLLPMLSQKLKMFWKCFALTSLIIFLALKTVKWNLDLINPYILRITCNILYPSNDKVYRKERQCILPIPWPFTILTVLNPKFGFNQGDIKQDRAIQELENLQSNLLGEMSILINYFWSCLKAVSCTI